MLTLGALPYRVFRQHVLTAAILALPRDGSISTAFQTF